MKQLHQTRHFLGIARVVTTVLLLSAAACAEMTLQNNTLNVQTSGIAATFRGAAVISLVNKATGQEYIHQPSAEWFTLNMMDAPPKQMATGTWTLGTDPTTNQPLALITYTDGGRSATLSAGIDAERDEIVLRTNGSSTQAGVQSLTWGVRGLDLDAARLVIPGQAGVYFGRNTSPAAIALDYPTHWEAGFVVYEAPLGSLLIYAHQGDSPQFSGLRASRQNGNLDLGFEMFSVAPWSGATSTPAFEWRMKAFPGQWREPAAYYKAWMSDTGTQSAAPRPPWTKEIYSVVTITYLDIDSLNSLAEKLIPQRTLLYVVPWRASGYDLNYPDYTPTPEAGDFVARAHQLGFRVMLHTNMLGVSETNPLYEKVKDCQLRTPDSQASVGWLWNLDPGDIHRVAYMSPSCAAYRQAWIESVRRMVDQLGPDALHLDAGGTIQNDGNGLTDGENTIQGMIEFQKEIQAAFPTIALGYESITEVNAPFISFAQRWSENAEPHPISNFLFGDQTFFFGFLDQPNPDESQFIEYLRHYEVQGVLPTVAIGSLGDFDSSKPRAQQVINQMRLWQENRFVPDWSNDWQGATFRFKSLENDSPAVIEESDQSVALKINDTVFYERIKNATSVTTAFSIVDWPAHDAGTYSGLDPGNQYWLDPTSNSANTLHLSDVPSSIKVTADTFIGDDFALVSLASNQPPTFDFVANFNAAKKGTMYHVPGLVERGLELGAAAQINSAFVGGEVTNSVLVMQPPFQHVAGGVTFTEFSVPVPDMEVVALRFQVALPDSSLRSVPVLFSIWIEEQEAWREYIGKGAWQSRSIDLSRYRGQTIQVRLISGPGSNNNALYAYGCWGNLTISSNSRQPNSQFLLHLPVASDTAPLVPGTSAERVSGDPTAYKITMDVPGQFLTFLQEPIPVAAGTDLLDLPYSMFRRTFDGLPSRYVAPDNGYLLSNTKLGGALLDRAVFVNPPQNGRIYLTWILTLPDNASQMDFTYGLMDPAPPYQDAVINYSGAKFLIFINGKQVFQQAVSSAGSNSGSVDLSSWAGHPVIIQLAQDADGTAIYDWCLWSRPTIH